MGSMGVLFEGWGPFFFEFNVSRRERDIGLAVLRRLEIHVYRNSVFSNVYLLMFVHYLSHLFGETLRGNWFGDPKPQISSQPRHIL